MRRIKSASLTIPCVTGPYVGVNGKVTLLQSSVRHDASTIRSYPRDDSNGPDPRFTDYAGAIESIVTSGAQNDAGLFEMNLRDERYLPFEGAGAVQSRWRIELPTTLRHFDYDSISDVILHIRYTAREGGDALKQKALDNLNQSLQDGKYPGQTSLFSFRHDFPTEWAKFKGSPATAGGYLLEWELKPAHYPYWASGRLKTTVAAEVFVRNSKASTLTVQLDSAAHPDTMPVGHGLSSQALANAKPGSPTGGVSWLLSDNSMDEIWLMLTWKQGT